MSDPIERERRKARWEIRFAGWLADAGPSGWSEGKLLFLWSSVAFFSGTPTVSSLFGLNLLASFLIAEAAVVLGLIVYEGIRQNRRRQPGRR